MTRNPTLQSGELRQVLLCIVGNCILPGRVEITSNPRRIAAKPMRPTPSPPPLNREHPIPRGTPSGCSSVCHFQGFTCFRELYENIPCAHHRLFVGHVVMHFGLSGEHLVFVRVMQKCSLCKVFPVGAFPMILQ